MKSFLLFLCFLFSALLCKSQNSQVNKLLPGKYETFTKANQHKWDRGDIVLLDDNRYKISTDEEIGEYKFSVSAQRVFFVSGPLKNFYAKASLKNNNPVIVLPFSENERMGLKLPSEVCGYYKH